MVYNKLFFVFRFFGFFCSAERSQTSFVIAKIGPRRRRSPFRSALGILVQRGDGGNGGGGDWLCLRPSSSWHPLWVGRTTPKPNSGADSRPPPRLPQALRHFSSQLCIISPNGPFTRGRILGRIRFGRTLKSIECPDREEPFACRSCDDAQRHRDNTHNSTGGDLAAITAWTSFDCLSWCLCGCPLNGNKSPRGACWWHYIIYLDAMH